MAGEKTYAELKIQINAGIKANGKREITPSIHNAIESDIANSSLNKKDGGVIQAILAYLNEYVLTDRKQIAHVGYVDDAVESVVGFIQSDGFGYWKKANPTIGTDTTGDIREGVVGSELQLQEFDTIDAPGVWTVRNTR